MLHQMIQPGHKLDLGLRGKLFYHRQIVGVDLSVLIAVDCQQGAFDLFEISARI